MRIAIDSLLIKMGKSPLEDSYVFEDSTQMKKIMIKFYTIMLISRLSQGLFPMLPLFLKGELQMLNVGGPILEQTHLCFSHWLLEFLASQHRHLVVNAIGALTLLFTH